MASLVRKIERTKWTQNLDMYDETGEVAPYPITNDMRTCSNNTLSVWEVDDTDDEFENIVLTIATMRDNLQTLDIVVFKKEELKENGISIIESEGETPLEDFRSNHRDLSDLSMTEIKYLSNKIIEYVISSQKDFDEYVLRFTKSTLRDMFIKKIKSGTIKLDVLNQSFQKYIKKKLK